MAVLAAHDRDLEGLATDFALTDVGRFQYQEESAGQSYSWGHWSVYQVDGADFVAFNDESHKEFRAKTLDGVAVSAGLDAIALRRWRERAAALSVVQIRKTNVHAIELRFAPGGHGLRYVPRSGMQAATSMTNSLVAESKPSADGVVKFISDRWSYFTDSPPR